MTVTEQDYKDLSKALSYANWAALGLLVPFLGWLLGGMALSFIKPIPRTEKTELRLNQVKKTAWVAIVASSLAAGIWIWLYNNQFRQDTQPTPQTVNCENIYTYQGTDPQLQELDQNYRQSKGCL